MGAGPSPAAFSRSRTSNSCSTLKVPAQVGFKFVRAVPGRLVRKRCVAPTHSTKHKHRCTRGVVTGALAFAARAGGNNVRFQGVLANGKRLPPGRYTPLVNANASGRLSRTATVTFTILR